MTNRVWKFFGHASNNILSTPTGPFSCSTSIFLEDSASLTRFNNSLPRSFPRFELKFPENILQNVFIHQCRSRPPSWKFPLVPVSDRTLETLKTRLPFTRVYGGKNVFVNNESSVWCQFFHVFPLFSSSFQQITITAPLFKCKVRNSVHSPSEVNFYQQWTVKILNLGRNSQLISADQRMFISLPLWFITPLKQIQLIKIITL